MTANQIEVLLVEDDPGDVVLIQEALAEQEVVNRLSVVHDGVDAMSFLRRTGRFADAPRPDLVLLDLNLPRKNGREVLAESKGDPDLRLIPMVVLTTSSTEEDVVASYRLHANAYITKPADFERFTEVVHQIDEFFADLVTLPPRDPPPKATRAHGGGCLDRKTGEGEAAQLARPHNLNRPCRRPRQRRGPQS